MRMHSLEAVQDPPASGPEPFRLGRRRSLDGVRGLAILMVLVSHLRRLTLQGGLFGVDLFFVLSGFLITSLLLEEWQETGRINLAAFYARRALRLLPALVAVLLALLVLSGVRESAPETAALAKAAFLTLFYSANWFLAFGAYPRAELSPTWSLSVEEQFYLLWPLLLGVMLRRKWTRAAVAATVILALLASAGARAFWWWAGASVDRIYFGSDTHADGLLAGALAALVLSWGLVPRSASLRWGFNGGALLFVGFLPVLLLRGWHADPSMYLGTYLAVNLAATVLVVCLVSSPWIGLRVLFEAGPLVWMGRVSYGLYLWHIPVFWVLGPTVPAIAVTGAVAAASYLLLERPILRLKRRFDRGSTGGAPA